MTKKNGDDTGIRYVPPGSCNWCGHPPHDGHECTRTIRTKVGNLRCTCPRKDA